MRRCEQISTELFVRWPMLGEPAAVIVPLSWRTRLLCGGKMGDEDIGAGSASVSEWSTEPAARPLRFLRLKSTQ